MPRPRDVKPWTIYPPTQEDREIIEKKAAAASLSVSAYLCMVGKLATIQVKTGREQRVLSAPAEPEQGSTPTYKLLDQFGKALKPEIEALVRIEYEAGRVQPINEQEQDYFGDPVSVTSRRGKLYQCTIIGMDSEIPFTYEFRVMPAPKEA